MTSVAGILVRHATPAEYERWDDLVQRFPSHRLVHRRAWLESLDRSGAGQSVCLVFEQEGELVGCLPGTIATVAGLRVFGSPLPGCQTVSMGPVFDPTRVSTAELMEVAIPFLEAHHRVSYIEMMHDALDHDAMRETGFIGRPVFTYRAPLFPDERRTFRGMKDNARRNIRRAERLGLQVRFEHDIAFVDEHYEQLEDVYRRGGHAIPFGKRRVEECFRAMHAAGHLLAVSVTLPGSHARVATGMFLRDDRELMLWTWAHSPHYRWYRATEFMTWAVMRRALESGCTSFDLMGRGEFKAKFAAEPDLTKWRWMRGKPRWLAVARDTAEHAFRLQQAVRGRVARAARTALGRPGRGRNGAAACVLGDIDLVRALGLARIPTTVVAPPGAPARYSRVTRSVLRWTDPWDLPDDVVQSLLEFGQAQPEPPVLFYQEDRSLLLVSRNRERLGTAFRFVLPDAGLVEQLVDKAQFQELAVRLGLPVPPARTIRPADQSSAELLGIPFPVIMKPVIRRPERWESVAGPGKALRIEDETALARAWPAMAAANMTVLAQSLVDGPETAIESYHVYVGADRQIIAEFTGRKIRTLPAAFGDSTAVEITDSDEVRSVGRDVIRRLGLRGVAKLDFKRDAAGRLHLLEVNPRFTLWHHPGALAGVNIPAMVYADLAGLERPAAGPIRAGVRWCRPWTDRAAARAQGMGLLRWLGFAVQCEAKSAIAWNDPLPLARAIAWRLVSQPEPRLVPERPAPAAIPVAGPSGEVRP